MNFFPAVDPIPLPAPVWLFKALHVVTLSLHFLTVELLLGVLLLATLLNLLGTWWRGHPSSVVRLNAASSLARRLPVLMTFVINLGVPPLLFAQVLYGRAIYTSSVLIGFYWIAVIFLLMTVYWLLYRLAAGAEQGKAAWWKGLAALILAAGIAKIYSTNMTLMIRPEVWLTMYANTAHGHMLPPHDPTLVPRWLFMMTGSLVFGGVGLMWVAGRPAIDEATRRYMAGLGGWLSAVGAVVYLAVGWHVFHTQPIAVQQGLMAGTLYKVSLIVWAAMVALLAVMGIRTGIKKQAGRGLGVAVVHLGLVAMLGWAMFRDGLRDLTLSAAGYDVWNRVVVTNWPVVILFLVLFVAGLGGAGWLIYVLKQAKPISEKVV